MGKGAGLESGGWGAIGANEGVKYGATWTSYMPADAGQMKSDATLKKVEEKAPESPKSAGDFDLVGETQDSLATGGETAKKSSAACTIL